MIYLGSPESYDTCLQNRLMMASKEVPLQLGHLHLLARTQPPSSLSLCLVQCVPQRCQDSQPEYRVNNLLMSILGWLSQTSAEILCSEAQAVYPGMPSTDKKGNAHCVTVTAGKPPG
jgi:hypothetical protein